MASGSREHRDHASSTAGVFTSAVSVSTSAVSVSTPAAGVPAPAMSSVSGASPAVTRRQAVLGCVAAACAAAGTVLADRVAAAAETDASGLTGGMADDLGNGSFLAEKRAYGGTGGSPAEGGSPANGEPAAMGSDGDSGEHVVVGLCAVGDNLIHDSVYQEADYNAGWYGDGEYDFRPMYAGVADIVANNDLAFIDIETILGGDHLGLSGYPDFNSPSCLAQQIAECGWNLATTATNHSLDRGIQGIMNSCATWAAQPGVTMAGTYSSWEDRTAIRIREVRGIRFSFLAYTDFVNGGYLPPEYAFALATCDDLDLMDWELRNAKSQADVSIVAMSWGTENSFEPNENQRFLAQFLADRDVDLVIGFGPHVIQPIEWFEGRDELGNPTGHRTLVVFSLGNFLSNQYLAIENVEGCFSCTFVREAGQKDVHIGETCWTPLINHVGGFHRVFKLKDYTYDLAYQHWSLCYEADPLAFARQLTVDIIGPSGAWLDM